MEDFQVRDGDLDEAELAAYASSEVVAVDTETMGLLPRRDRLCLIQLCNQERVTVIRITKGQTAAPNLQQLLEAENVLKVFHFARFDMTALQYHLGIRVKPVFCTKIASKLARTYSPRHGLKDVVQELLQIELDKTAQSSDWGNAASLSPDQLKYAANDVLHLLAVQQKLAAMLQREDRWQLAQDSFNCLPIFVELDLLGYENLFDHH
ncbi:MAG TPA: ribonuclease D [Oscillatoriaceae cyanobacterium M33_DOE_052]|uniref:Ribonuclease D n=1 Tax=Planktothricoides sp. SpSt-374 TaxID=2282167 RepID=A0A7C3VLQ5_9CYAN|nr:ribonuclease D [Oscillatoriaceae cyanobacterium M33_DOE_052]